MPFKTVSENVLFSWSITIACVCYFNGVCELCFYNLHGQGRREMLLYGILSKLPRVGVPGRDGQLISDWADQFVVETPVNEQLMRRRIDVDRLRPLVSSDARVMTADTRHETSTWGPKPLCIWCSPATELLDVPAALSACILSVFQNSQDFAFDWQVTVCERLWVWARLNFDTTQLAANVQLFHSQSPIVSSEFIVSTEALEVHTLLRVTCPISPCLIAVAVNIQATAPRVTAVFTGHWLQLVREAGIWFH